MICLFILFTITITLTNASYSLNITPDTYFSGSNKQGNTKGDKGEGHFLLQDQKYASFSLPQLVMQSVMTLIDFLYYTIAANQFLSRLFVPVPVLKHRRSTWLIVTGDYTHYITCNMPSSARQNNILILQDGSKNSLKYLFASFLT